MSEDVPYQRSKARRKGGRRADPFVAYGDDWPSQYVIARAKIDEDLSKHNKQMTDFGFDPSMK